MPQSCLPIGSLVAPDSLEPSEVMADVCIARKGKAAIPLLEDLRDCQPFVNVGQQEAAATTYRTCQFQTTDQFSSLVNRFDLIAPFADPIALKNTEDATEEPCFALRLKGCQGNNKLTIKLVFCVAPTVPSDPSLGILYEDVERLFFAIPTGGMHLVVVKLGDL
tara:strand:+ start:1483 stop:1974 length:492 start_codon:yes stop_codon:yes gene_type:complete